MQAEFVQWEKSVKAACLFYVNVIRRLEDVSLSERSNWKTSFDKEKKSMTAYPKKGNSIAIRLLQGEDQASLLFNAKCQSRKRL